MAWHDGLLSEQKDAAEFIGGHSRLLAGPGTGKTLTLTRHVCFLIEDKNIDSEKILVLTFTRAAAHELRQRIESEIGADLMPRISTLHAFALRQLLKNSNLLKALPQPLRIADDWEERNIILEDLRSLVELHGIKETSELLNQLSSDWQTLDAEEDDWNKKFSNPAFIGAWQEHRQIFGYTLRSELIYQLKRSLAQYGDFILEGPPDYLLVDEYQDLNRCDLAVIAAIKEKGTEVFVAGDDDQSIYGFRKAHPEGIRRFDRDYEGAESLSLSICKRCDPNILELGLFIAKLDPRRLEKELKAEEGRDEGKVAILRFPDQDDEVAGVASLCQYLIEIEGLLPHEILILLRSDYRNVFSSLIVEKFDECGVPITSGDDPSGPLDSNDGRYALALMRLSIRPDDDLAWRTVLMLGNFHVGGVTIQRIYDYSRSNSLRFSEAVRTISRDPSTLDGGIGNRVKNAVLEIQSQLESINSLVNGDETAEGTIDSDALSEIVRTIIPDSDMEQEIIQSLQTLTETLNASSVKEIVNGLEASSVGIEQEIEKDKVNILTMHKAKGLTAKATIIMAAEDEYLPGKAEGNSIDDERRLLYVSLTRAKHFLYVTYCDNRTNRQRHSGRTSGQTRRTLTQFLRDAPVDPILGADYIIQLDSTTS